MSLRRSTRWASPRACSGDMVAEVRGGACLAHEALDLGGAGLLRPGEDLEGHGTPQRAVPGPVDRGAGAGPQLLQEGELAQAADPLGGRDARARPTFAVARRN